MTNLSERLTSFTKPTGRHHQVRPSTRGIGLVATLIGVCVLAVIVVVVMASMGGASTTPAPVTTAAPTGKDPTVTPQGRAFLAEIYREGIGPDEMDAHGAVILAAGLCQQHRARVGLATLSLRVRGMFPALTKMQAARLVDDAIRYYCP